MSALASLAFALTLASGALSNSLADIDHVVLFMQENRAFDHYFGTLAGVRGFADPNVQVNPGSGQPNVFYQDVDPQLVKNTTALLPWHLNYLGGDWVNATQCMGAGSNGWHENHAAYNGGLNNKWATGNSPYAWSYFKRDDIPVHFAIADAYTTADMYSESVIAATCPNRAMWASGSINVPGGHQNTSAGGPYTDNYETPGCETSATGEPVNCYPLKWTTTPELLEKAGVSWYVYQGTDNFDDNPLAWFAQFQTASNTSALAQKGLAMEGLEKFYNDAKAGTLPAVSYVIGPMELSEHPPFTPRDGAWLQRQVVEAVMNSPAYARTALIISYDETGGFGDHVTPIVPPRNTPGEWMSDPYDATAGSVPSGPGYRLPFYVISPWTRNGGVFVEHADHTSQIFFLEKWLASKGKNITTPEINSWRRQHMSDLVKMFDFEHPDLSIPTLPDAIPPHTDSNGNYDGYARCQAMYPNQNPPIPYGSQNASQTLKVEKGSKAVRGNPTEGRYLVFENELFALDSRGSKLVAGSRTPDHQAPSQRFVLHSLAPPPSTKFQISAGNATGPFVQADLSLGDKAAAEIFNIKDLGNGKGYTVQNSEGQFLYVLPGHVGFSRFRAAFEIYSVTF